MKRSNGEGSICRRSNGKGWVGSLTLGHDENGKQLRRFVSGDTQQEVRAKLDAIKQERERGTAAPSNARLTVAEAVDRWLTYKARDLRLTTMTDYRTHCQKFIVPKLGSVRLDKLTAMHVEDLLVSMLDSGQSAARATRCLKIVKMALSQAVDWELVGRNVAERIKPPKVQRQEMKVWNPAEVQRFLTAAEGHRYHALFYLALVSGMRRGEMLGLRWSDVDTARAQLTVARSVVYVAGGLHVSEPKTAAGKRVITLSPDVLEVLTAHRLTYGVNELVFSSSKGNFLNPSNVARKFEVLCQRASVPHIRFHDLRHTSASLLIRSNVSAKVVSDRLGHADSGFTLRTYVHVFDDQRRAAALSLGEMLREAGD
ncbi:site-specific integrase [Deinococcus rubellus]|uniref:Site-specific integrase n=1 Tax=Deinococcus rubellus TaxID=1889240 RepID=A0ABY5YH83_9DEIO|nr:site-specific integrase [Deinococcus rubellus]UWX64286.1 site-specific integrase [Deinococcus rubellus]